MAIANVLTRDFFMSGRFFLFVLTFFLLCSQLYGAKLDRSLPVPKALQLVERGFSTVKIKWKLSGKIHGNISGFKIFRDGIEVGTSLSNEFYDVSLLPGRSFSYRVVSYFEDKISRPGNILRVRTSVLEHQHDANFANAQQGMKVEYHSVRDKVVAIIQKYNIDVKTTSTAKYLELWERTYNMKECSPA